MICRHLFLASLLAVLGAGPGCGGGAVASPVAVPDPDPGVPVLVRIQVRHVNHRGRPYFPERAFVLEPGPGPRRLLEEASRRRYVGGLSFEESGMRGLVVEPVWMDLELGFRLSVSRPRPSTLELEMEWRRAPISSRYRTLTRERRSDISLELPVVTRLTARVGLCLSNGSALVELPSPVPGDPSTVRIVLTLEAGSGGGASLRGALLGEDGEEKPFLIPGGARAHLAWTRIRSFLADYDVKMGQSAFFYETLVDSIETGHTLDIGGSGERRRETITRLESFEVHLTSFVSRPLPVVETPRVEIVRDSGANLATGERGK